jgi:DNA-directed RNA polymerase specialized sigma24 family protein
MGCGASQGCWPSAKEAPQAYARAVLVNACRERWRHRGRHPEVSRNLDEFANVVSFAEAVDRRHVVVRVLRRLPDIQREVLVRRYLLDATVARRPRSGATPG